jgi:myo-inositol-1(or 4)-monophosphatase
MLLRFFGRVRQVRIKEHQSSVVCEADLASEELVVAAIRRAYPEDAVIGEEGGVTLGASGFTWVIDPLDGTSNFVAGIPWFGAQIALFHEQTPVAGALYVPCTRRLYYGGGRGAATDAGQRLRLSPETDLKRMLCAFGFDPGAPPRELRQILAMLGRVAGGCRNIRATNSLMDFCLVLDGHLGGAINLGCKVWDISPVAAFVRAAGGNVTDLHGQPLEWDLGPNAGAKDYQILLAPAQLHPALLRLVRG